MEIVVDFPGSARVNARFGPYVIQTDQPPPGGKGSAPSPFDTFLASLAACAGYYVLSFCVKRDIPTNGLRLVQRTETDPTSHRVSRVRIDIQLPPNFPDKYKDAVIRAADQCAVKKLLMQPPVFDIVTVTSDTVNGGQ